MASRTKQIKVIQKKAAAFCEHVGKIRDDMEAEYNNMSIADQVSDDGVLLSDRIETLGEWVDYLEEMTEPVL